VDQPDHPGGDLLGLYTRWFNPWALIAGWAAGLVTGTAMVASTGFQSATYPLALDGLIVPGYAALYSLILNFVVAAVLTPVFNVVAGTRGSDQTAPVDYHFEPAQPAETPAPLPATAFKIFCRAAALSQRRPHRLSCSPKPERAAAWDGASRNVHRIDQRRTRRRPCRTTQFWFPPNPMTS
jgi:hypothetical protein